MPIYKFQFHFGTIDSLAASKMLKPSTRFNSTLVRLIEANGITSKADIESFNSTLVRLIEMMLADAPRYV